MDLVVQGAAIAPDVLQRTAALVGADTIETLQDHAYRLIGAQREQKQGQQQGQELAQELALCALATQYRLDFAWIPTRRKLADFGLFVTDMDSTLINIECIDELADLAGKKAEVSAITEAAMAGELDFRASLLRRVALLAGLPESALEQVYRERLALNPGAARLITTLKAHDIRLMLVSGGFTYFTDRLAAQHGFDWAYANQLEIQAGQLTGKLLGPIIDAEAKAAHLQRVRDQLGLRPDQVLAAGDGANDLPMFAAAGFSVAYHPKPALRAAASCSLEHVGLDGILPLFD